MNLLRVRGHDADEDVGRLEVAVHDVAAVQERLPNTMDTQSQS